MIIRSFTNRGDVTPPPLTDEEKDWLEHDKQIKDFQDFARDDRSEIIFNVSGNPDGYTDEQVLELVTQIHDKYEAKFAAIGSGMQSDPLLMTKSLIAIMMIADSDIRVNTLELYLEIWSAWSTTLASTTIAFGDGCARLGGELGDALNGATKCTKYNITALPTREVEVVTESTKEIEKWTKKAGGIARMFGKSDKGGSTTVSSLKESMTINEGWMPLVTCIDSQVDPAKVASLFAVQYNSTLVLWKPVETIMLMAPSAEMLKY